MVQITNINGLLGTNDITGVVGIITSGEDNAYYIEDTTMKIKLDLC